ncbi:sm-like protein LSM8 [Gossypium australe]|uniref:U6 snRNA-associated Sm-like protein LSm8 n=1 Tax=Gossypium australe TaxID=47621 RepID=A0A5B6VU43_9ROSI|nr:sm-like protein LSM8 [Gossypium australe]
MSTGPGLESLVDQTISVITNDGRNIVGVLKGFDQATNIILDESHERVYSTKEGVQQLVLGLYIIRGDNISVVGELDEELDSALDLSNLRAHPLKPKMMLKEHHHHHQWQPQFVDNDQNLMIPPQSPMN